ncbi:MAG: MaoC family dehydratase N-terminal domain-containing protein [Devosia sp.]
MAGPVELSSWIGRSRTQQDRLDPQPARFMQATLGLAPDLKTGDLLPPLWHWLYFLEARPMDELGRDGHVRRGGFLPPVALPRRMWAGGRLTFNVPLRLGAAVRRVSTITKVTEKTGRTGSLCFVTVCHEVFCDETVALNEEQDIVYREDPGLDAPSPQSQLGARRPDWSRNITPSPVQLFRYSALTFNGHRIHYDVDYARTVEGYPGLVFHGPLIATLLLDLAIQGSGGRQPAAYEFRALSPIAGSAPFRIEGSSTAAGADLWARRHDGTMAMRASASF